MLLCLLFSTTFSLPIKRYPCGANINGNLFNITNFANGRPNGFDVIREPNEDRYYFKMCGSLNNDDLPPLAPDATDISVMRCNYSSHECASAIPLQSFDWQLLNPNKPDDGVIYYASGEPFIDPEDKLYYTIDFEIQFKCDPSSTSSDIKYDYIVINKTNEVVVRIIFNTSYGCPTKADPPSPTPFFDPDCEFTYYFIPLVRYGVYTDFKQYNGGPYGIRTDLEIKENVKRTLFYQPCARMECPLNYTCTDTGYSSAWLCNQNGRTCESYGLISEDGIDAEIEDFFKNSSISIKHQTTNEKSIVLHVGCNKHYEYSHFDFEKQANLSNNQLTVKSYSHGSCPGYNPKPVPPFSGDMCYLRHSPYGAINFSHYNEDSGYMTYVTDTKTGKRLLLYYQPCGGLDCPTKSQCDGDTNATVWLCEEIKTDKKNDVYNDCIAYGLIENNLTFIEYFGEVGVHYKGDRKRTASVNYRCDSEGKSTDTSISISNSVSLVGTQLSFNVYSKNFCSFDSKDKKITGGAIFLIILLSTIILYIVIGLLVEFIKNGKITFPNVEFWKEFIACVTTGFLYIVKCGHFPLAANTQAKYDEIA
ncbi:hypothetical protein M9Y10_043483 [Tritrichomonas musculus]|uniref:MRH domain-containing protein n=1 Tax=Tritrichomonas musculus TaxID=1915356 RepID=A0ABR2K0U6_9EUKA